MIRTLKAELIKLRTTRTFFGLVAGSVAFVLLNCIAINFAINNFQGNGNFQGFSIVGNAAPLLIGLASSARFFTVSLGVLSMAGEYKHSTADATFLAEPNRMKVLLGKMLAAFIAGAAVALIAALVAVVVGGAILASNDFTVKVDGEVLRSFLGSIYIVGGMAAVGAAVGTLIRNQVGALIACLAWIFIGEGIVATASDTAGKFTFTGLLGSVVGAVGGGGGPGGDFGRALLPAATAAGLFLVYVAVLAAVGTARLRASDVA